ncbi:hypothetical protein CK203_046055 [Vitis vinifera]|uniref:Uncharacterized protein n=1 Tax=Vitis vinifera TaxID=29760 RepID=A0A438HP43_VITVI|nr:hypothetical protein CK203_046055 [Vitis vinifera]
MIRLAKEQNEPYYLETPRSLGFSYLNTNLIVIIPTRKTRINIPISLILPKVTSLVLEPVSESVFEPESSPIDPVPELESSPTEVVEN